MSVLNSIKKEVLALEKTVYKINKKENQAVINSALSKINIAKKHIVEIDIVEKKIKELEKKKENDIKSTMKAITEATILIKTIK
jgi:hypothetical protein